MSLAPLSVKAQSSIPPYAQPDPNATHAAPVPERTTPPEDPAVTVRAKEWLHRAQTGTFDRAQLESQMNTAITADGVKQASASLTALGKPTTFTYTDTLPSGTNLKTYIYRVTFPSRQMNWLFTLDGDGKIAGFYLQPESASEDQGQQHL